ncbi:ABC transporter permease [Actinomadura sp. DC4]|uniref:ABC transporter permease n=1 Tax=Actinomadura sp. DC4 TaxID=3055069 RepID=UPI0025B09288|nr:ABC transporter permease [Actinomadura sp. DC4]MDN3358691.1 ABC transporter permease [Actinomadura sp. DC4]
MRGLGAMSRVVRSGVGRRRVQTLVVTLATLMAVASAVVAGSLMVASSQPFDHAFARQHGPHLIAQVDTAKASAAQLAVTAHLSGVTASAGPYETAVINPLDPKGVRAPQLTVVGRATPGGGVDDLTLDSGRWAAKPGEIVIPTGFPPEIFPLGSVLRVPDGPALTVVGRAQSVSQTGDAWVVPGQLRALRAKGAPATAEMLYRFASAGTKTQIAAGRTTLASALPQGALVGTRSYLDTKFSADASSGPWVPFLMAFGALGLCMSVIIVSSVVSGAVGSSLRRIGILKAIGFTPGQVVRAYIAQALIPAVIGTALGVVLGNLLALPLLGDAGQVYGSPKLSVAWWVDLAVPAVALAVVVAAALVPALRAGRLRSIEAIAVGRAPSTGRGQWAHRAVGRLPLPRAVTLGLASPFARPVRTAAMVAAVVFGTAAATFAVGLTSSLNAVADAQHPSAEAAVSVLVKQPASGAPDGPPSLSAADRAQITGAIKAQPATQSYYGKAHHEVNVEGVEGTVPAQLFEGDSRDAAYEMIAGHWFTGPGQVVVPTHFLSASGKRIGDTITVVDQSVRVPLRIVGEAFDPGDDGMKIDADAASFAAIKGGAPIDSFDIVLKPGADASGYIVRLNGAMASTNGEAVRNDDSGGGLLIIIEAMAATLTLLLVAVAGLGVLNSVVLDTRERVHDLGVCKAVGMSPRQTITMVMASVAALGLVGGVIGVPIGVALHGFVLPRMGEGAGTALPPDVLSVYHALELVFLGLAGVAIAVLGASLPAGWAAKARTATALRTE